MLKTVKAGLEKLTAIRNKRMPFAVMLCVISTVASAMLLSSVKTVNIFDGEKNFTVRTMAEDVESVIDCASLKSDRYRITDVSVSGRVTSLTVAYTFPVYLTVGDKTTELETIPCTVSEILDEAGIKPDEYDMIEPAPDTFIEKTAYIDYVDIDYVSGSYTEPIPCSVETQYSSGYTEGTVKTLSTGTDGLKQVNYTSKLVNGTTVETTVDSVITLSAAVNGKKIVGTGKVVTATQTSNDVKCISTLVPDSPIQLDKNGVPVSYSKHMTVQATAYTYTGHNCATGVAPQPGYIAVNPKVIPYGTKLYIKSSDGSYIYGYAVAADTGGFSKKHPTNVDLFFASKSACKAFGRRNVEIYVIG